MAYSEAPAAARNWSRFNDRLTDLDIRVLSLGAGTLYAGAGSGVFDVSVAPEPARPVRSRR